MRFDIVTIFPGFFAGPLDYGIVRRAREAGIIQIDVHDLRNFTHDRHRSDRIDRCPHENVHHEVVTAENFGNREQRGKERRRQPCVAHEHAQQHQYEEEKQCAEDRNH